MSIDIETLQKRLKAARKMAGFANVREAADATGCPVPADTITSWESRGAEPRALALARLCEFYGVSLEWVTGRSDHPSGYPSHRVIVDQEVVELVNRAEKLDDLGEHLHRCSVCSAPEVVFGFEFPKRHRVTTAMQFAELFRTVSAKLDALRSDSHPPPKKKEKRR